MPLERLGKILDNIPDNQTTVLEVLRIDSCGEWQKLDGVLAGSGPFGLGLALWFSRAVRACYLSSLGLRAWPALGRIVL